MITPTHNVVHSLSCPSNLLPLLILGALQRPPVPSLAPPPLRRLACCCSRFLAAFLLWVVLVQAGVMLYTWRFCGGSAAEAGLLNM